MELSKEQHTALLKSINSYIEADEQYTYTINYNKVIYRSDMDMAIRRLIYKSEYGGYGYNYSLSTNLSITIQDGKKKLVSRLDNKNIIKKYWLDNILSNIKCKQHQEVSSINISDFNFSFHLDHKEESSYKIDAEGTEYNYTYTNNYNIVSTDDIPLTIIFSTVKHGVGHSFRGSKVLVQKPVYRLSFILDSALQKSGVQMDDDMLSKILIQISIVAIMVQGGYKLRRVSYQKTIEQSFLQLIGYNKGNDYHSMNVLGIPVVMQRKNLVEGNGINVLTDYTFALQPKGEPVMIYISSKDGCVYIIDSSLDFHPTDVYIGTWANTILQGVWIRSSGLVFLSDILWENGTDIRKRHLNIRGKSVKSDKCRIGYLRDVSKLLCKESMLSGVSFRMIEYKYASGKKLFETISDIWSKHDIMEYAIEGILFSPIHESYPEKGGIWEQQIIWRSPINNYIHFLVHIEKDDGGNDILSPLLVEGSERLLQYKTLELNVGASESEYDNTEKRWNRDYVVKPFNPYHEDSLDAHKHNHIPLEINSDGKLIVSNVYTGQCQSIYDDYIVALTYYPHEDNFQFKPIEVAIRETEWYHNGVPGYYFPEKIANRTWESMVQPVTPDMITTGVIIESGSLGQIGGGLSKLDLAETKYPYQNFHRLIVNRLLLEEVALDKNYMTGDLIDFACSRGSDLINWKHAKFASVVSLDINKACINYAKEFYKRFSSPKPVSHYIWADASQLIFPKGRAGLNKLAKIALREYIPSKWIFDVVTLEYSLPYYFENEEKLRGLIQNINDCLKIGGKLIGTSLDGERVFKSLRGKKRSGWIGKEYTTKKYIKRMPNYGMKISVRRDDEINYQEFLVNFTYFDKIMKEYGFELVRCDGFSSYEARMEEVPPEIQEISAMTDEEKLFSFLHNAFIYQKIKHSSERLYRYLKKLYME